MHEIHVCVIGSTDPLSSLMKYLAVTIDREKKWKPIILTILTLI